ncbi:tetratricopeptide repeat protein [bacterium]|nr:tetratricopeptide repeat protein [bacterium]
MPERDYSFKLIFLAALISAIAAFALYLPSLGFDFVDWDDPAYVSENPDIQGIDLKWAFTAVVVGTWIPLTFLSFALDYAVWGLDPLGYHLTNTILHSANVFLVAFLAARLAGRRGGLGAGGIFLMALSAGLLFGLHPLRAESVAWVSERKDVLNAFFFLLGLHAYLGYAENKKASSYVLTLVLFVLSLLSKPMTVTMPLVLLILDYYPLERLKREGWKRPLIEKLPFLMLSLAAGLMTIWSQGKAVMPPEALPFADRIHIAARGYLFYIYKSVIPAGLAPLYPRDFASGLNLSAVLYLAALAAITILALYLRRWSKAFISAWACYAVTLLPVIGLMQVGRQAAADRYTYIPAIGLAILVSAAAGWIVKRNSKSLPAVLALVLAASGLLSFFAFKQEMIWKNPVSLWSRQIEVFPSHSQGYVNRSAAYVALGMNESAIEDLRKMSPESGHGYFNRGNAYLTLGRFDLAIPDLDKAIELEPNTLPAYSSRGSALVNAGRFREGISDFTVVLDSDPGNKAIFRARGTAYAISGQYGEALEDFLKAAELDPGDPSAHIDLGKVYMHLGNFERSYASMRKALELGDTSASRYISDLEARGADKGNIGLQTGGPRW